MIRGVVGVGGRGQGCADGEVPSTYPSEFFRDRYQVVEKAVRAEGVCVEAL